MNSPLLVNLSFLSHQPTGISTYARNLFPQLRSLNPTLLVSTKIEDFPCYPIAAGMTPDQGSKGHFRRLLWTQFQLPLIYRKLRSHLLFSPVTEAPLWLGCRSVVTVHDLIPLRFPQRLSPLTLYGRYYMPLVIQQAEHIITNSIATAKDVIQFCRIPESKVTPIPLAYEEQIFRFLDLPTQNYFLYLGRIDPYKNVQRLISAFARLPNCSEYELWLAGPPDRRYLPALKVQIEELNISHQVRFLNYVPAQELPILINQAIALVFPTLWEGFGIPALEAMACGTPVITSNRASLPEVVGEAGILIDPLDVGAIAEAMGRVATEPGCYSHLRTAGLARAAQFSWKKTGQATIEVLQRFL